MPRREAPIDDPAPVSRIRQGTAGWAIRSRLIALAFLTLAGLASLMVPRSEAVPDYTLERAEMVRTIESHAREAGLALRGDQIDPKILEVLRAAPRHQFVPESLQEASYADRALPIGFGQTISQPFIVALMTDVLNVGPNGVVLEVGTGSGYQAAVLAQLVRQVYTIEVIPALAARAADRLNRLGHANVSVRQGDGYYGLREAAPFDGIIVTAAAGHIPPPLLEQLKPGGRMVIPVGPLFGLQHLTVVERDPEGRVRTRQLFPVHFVPLTGQH
jgi:protein-L-isoaspartate(D-aspartate) O-methyltransferase